MSDWAWVTLAFGIVYGTLTTYTVVLVRRSRAPASKRWSEVKRYRLFIVAAGGLLNVLIGFLVIKSPRQPRVLPRRPRSSTMPVPSRRDASALEASGGSRSVAETGGEVPVCHHGRDRHRRGRAPRCPAAALPEGIGVVVEEPGMVPRSPATR